MLLARNSWETWGPRLGLSFACTTGCLQMGVWAHSVSLCPSDKYAVRFIPRENGIYLIDVKFNGTHIPGSPFKIRVGEPGHGGDPGLVSAYGPGLEGGVTGKSVGAVSCVTTGGLWR